MKDSAGNTHWRIIGRVDLGATYTSPDARPLRNFLAPTPAAKASRLCLISDAGMERSASG